VIWNKVYRVLSDVNDDVCDYPLARNLVMLTVTVACEAIVSFVTTGEQRHFTITLKDLSIQPLETWFQPLLNQLQFITMSDRCFALC
jgi:molybdopterin-synthase adenylyltransferase